METRRIQQILAARLHHRNQHLAQLALQLRDAELGIGNAHREVLCYAKRLLDSSFFVAFPPMFAGVSMTTHKVGNVLVRYTSGTQRCPIGPGAPESLYAPTAVRPIQF